MEFVWFNYDNKKKPKYRKNKAQKPYVHFLVHKKIITKFEIELLQVCHVLIFQK